MIKIRTARPFRHSEDTEAMIACEIAISQDEVTWYHLDVGGIPLNTPDLQTALEARFAELFDVALANGRIVDDTALVDKDTLRDRWQGSPFAAMRPAAVFQAAQTTVDGWKSVDDMIATLRVWLPLLLADIAHRNNEDAKP
jgi:hypothetical protein